MLVEKASDIGVRKELEGEHEGEIKIEFIDYLFWLLFQSLLLVFHIALLAAFSSHSCDRGVVFFIWSLLQCFCVPVAELDDGGYDRDDYEEIDDKDSDEHGFMREKVDLSVEDDGEVLRVIGNYHLQVPVENSLWISKR